MIRHIVYECLPGAYAGGVQKMVFELASAQRRLGEDVEIWTPNAIRAGAAEDYDGLIIRYFMPGRRFGLAQSDRLERALANLKRGSVLHAHNTFHPLNLQAGRAARRFGHRAFYHPHGAIDPVLLRALNFKALKKHLYIAAFERPNLNDAAGIFALTEMERQQLLDLRITAPIHVVPNGIRPVEVVGPDEGLAFRQRHGIPGSAPLILYIGRIVPKKRIEAVIAALSSLEKSHPGLRLAVAGSPTEDPDYHQRLLLLIASAGLTDRIHWIGFLDEKTKCQAYAAAQLFVHASESEGMALAILEAMSAGLPVVATRGCYMSEAAEAGALIECSSGPDALAAAMAPLLADPVRAQTLGAAGRAYVGRVHAWAEIARATLRIYAGQGGIR